MLLCTRTHVCVRERENEKEIKSPIDADIKAQLKFGKTNFGAICELPAED